MIRAPSLLRIKRDDLSSRRPVNSTPETHHSMPSQPNQSQENKSAKGKSGVKLRPGELLTSTFPERMRELQEQLEKAQAEVEAEQEAERVRLLERQREVEEAQRREERKRVEAEAAKRAEAHAAAERSKQGVVRHSKDCDQCRKAGVACEWQTGGRVKACDRCREQHATCKIDGQGVGPKKRKRTEAGVDPEPEAGPSRQQESGVRGPETENGGLAALNGTLVLIARKLGGIQATLTGMLEAQEGLLDTLTLMCERMGGEESESEPEPEEVAEVAAEIAELNAEKAEHQTEKKAEKRTEKRKAKKPETEEEETEEAEETEETGPAEKKQRKE